MNTEYDYENKISWLGIFILIAIVSSIVMTILKIAGPLANLNWLIVLLPFFIDVLLFVFVSGVVILAGTCYGLDDIEEELSEYDKIEPYTESAEQNIS